jgi:SAM-dependent methyltransferase
MNTDDEIFDVVMGVDWNQAWKAGRARTHHRWDGRAFWNSRAASFATHARDSGYCDEVMAILRPAPDWTVLDIGCAAGTLAIPLASKVKAVTGLDVSDAMLALLGQRCAELGITNVQPVLAGWEDDWAAAGVPVHDVVLASRSLFAADLRAAVAKLQAFARKRVVIVSLVGDGPYDRAIFEAVGRSLYRGPDFRFVTNFLAQEGIFANVSFIHESEDKTYATLDDAVQGMRWMLDGMTPTEETLLRAHLHNRCVPRDGGLALPKPKVTQWAAIWWDRT